MLDYLHELLDVGDFLLLEAHDIELTLGVLQGIELVSLVEKIEEFSAVNFKERYRYTQVLELRLLQQTEHIVRCQQIESWYSLV